MLGQDDLAIHGVGGGLDILLFRQNTMSNENKMR